VHYQIKSNQGKKLQNRKNFLIVNNRKEHQLTSASKPSLELFRNSIPQGLEGFDRMSIFVLRVYAC
jgi:hypothetical protein